MRIKLLLALGLLPMALPTGLLVSGGAGTSPVATGQARSFEGNAKVAVEAPPALTNVGWILDPADSSRVKWVLLGFAGALPVGSFACVQVRDATPAILANGCIITSGLAPIVPLDSIPSPTASAAAITGVDVTVTAPVTSVNGPNGLKVTDVAWTLLEEDTTQVEKVRVTFGPTGTKRDPRVDIRLTLKDAAGDRLQRKEFRNVTLSRNSNTLLTWDLGPPVWAAAIARFEVRVEDD